MMNTTKPSRTFIRLLLAGVCLPAIAVATFAAAAAALAAPAAAAHATAHKFHTSLTRIEYNAATQSVEITIRTFADDLEEILTRRNGKSVRLRNDARTEQLVFEYLKSSFELRSGTGAGEPRELRWVGMELKSDAVWLYAEAPMPEGLRAARLRNHLLFDLFADQVNLVNVLDGEKKTNLVFKRGDGAQLIR